MYKFLPSYVGSKKHWIEFLERYRGEDFVELFCGSAIISANLAKTAILVDKDPFIAKIMANFDKLVVPDRFSQSDYFKYRKDADWWKYAFCLQKMSFSGVFRHSKNGYNVPVKKRIEYVEIREDYEFSLKRWKDLCPEVLNCSYDEVSRNLLSGKIVIMDPPYEGSQASYNFKFDSCKYWEYLESIKDEVKALVVFDRESNFEKRRIPILGTRKMRVNGARQGDSEAVAIYENGGWLKNE